MDIIKKIIEEENKRLQLKANIEPIRNSGSELVDEAVYFGQGDRADYPNRGHLPGRNHFRSGKVVTNPGLNHNGWVDTTQ